MSLLLRNRIFVLLKRSNVIQHPEAASVRGHHQVSVLNHQVVYRGRRKIQLKRLPVRAIIERNVHTLFGSGEKQTCTPGIDPDGMDKIVRGKPRDQFGPGLAKICGLEHVGCEVVQLVAFDGEISGACFTPRNLDHAHRAPVRHGLGGDVLPMLATIARELNQSVIGSCPNQSLLYG